jgi:hypothetical protein
MRTAVIIFCICVMANQAAAQAEQPSFGGLAATGHVVGPDGQPQPGVLLHVEGPQGRTAVVTDEKGKWFLYNLAPGPYKVQPAVGQKDDGGSAPSLSFYVKERSTYDRFVGKESAVYEAPEIKLNYSPAPTR